MDEMTDIARRSLLESIQAKKRCLERGPASLVQAAAVIVEAFYEENKLMIFGNGGSAADAQHIAAELVNRFMIERPPLPAMALTTDTSILTSVGNDYDFKDIFAKQVKALGVAGDVAWGISTSGTSANIVEALVAARERGLRTIGMTGPEGGKVAEVVDVLIQGEGSSTARIQECHITFGHIICELVDYRLFQRLER
ncbi:MAG: D-sedoheptulose 7-phosphate isomerase [Deltaproteobacteria bacterium]|nr:D-sedoheptulose 7-phosphate isomerase [Deltaproteobacteria bacterium]MBW2069961.1 D-sedoheptulose 7-phosphate isomerase [Deltaproteobacteria bacterium]